MKKKILKRNKKHQFPLYGVIAGFVLFGIGMLGLSWSLFGSTPQQDSSQEARVSVRAQVTESDKDSLTLRLLVQNEMDFPVEDVALVFEWPAGFYVKEIQPSPFTYKERLRQVEIGTVSANEKKSIEVIGVATIAVESFSLPIKVGYQSQEGVKQEMISVLLPSLHPESQIRLEMPQMAPIQGRVPFTIWFDPVLAESGMQIQIHKPVTLELIESSVSFNEDTLFVEGETQGKITGSFFANTTQSQRVQVKFDVKVVLLGKSLVAKTLESSLALFTSGLVTQTSINGEIPDRTGLEVGRNHTLGIRITNKGTKAVTRASVFIPFNPLVLEFIPAYYDEQKKGYVLNEQTHPALSKIDPGEVVEVSVDASILPSFDPVHVFAGGQEQIILKTVIGFERDGTTWQQQVPPLTIKFSSDLKFFPKEEQGQRISIDIQNSINWVEDVVVRIGYSGGNFKNKSIWKGKSVKQEKNVLEWNVGTISPGKPLTGLRLEFDDVSQIEWISWTGKDRHTTQTLTGEWKSVTMP